MLYSFRKEKNKYDTHDGNKNYENDAIMLKMIKMTLPVMTVMTRRMSATIMGPTVSLFSMPLEPPAMARKSWRPRAARFAMEKGSSPFRPNSSTLRIR